MWKTVCIVKRFIPLCVILFLSWTAYAEKTTEVALRCSNQNNSMKIVLEAEPDFIRKTNAVISFSSVTVEFPSAFELKKQKDFPFAAMKKENSLSITLKDISDVKTYKLTSPARLVIDLKPVAKAQADAGAGPEQKPQGPDQKSGPEISPQVSPKKAPEAVRQPGKAPAAAAVPLPTRKRVVVIDPGHGGYETGIVSGDAKEKDFDVVLSRDLAAALAKKGATVYLTRKTDQNASIADRINFSNSKSPDLFISIHSTESDKFIVYTAGPEESGLETAVKQYSQFSNQTRFIEKSREMARGILDALKKSLETGVAERELPLPVLSAMKAPAVLLECPLVKAGGSDQKYRDRLVNSLVKGMGYE